MKNRVMMLDSKFEQAGIHYSKHQTKKECASSSNVYLHIEFHLNIDLFGPIVWNLSWEVTIGKK